MRFAFTRVRPSQVWASSTLATGATRSKAKRAMTVRDKEVRIVVHP